MERLVERTRLILMVLVLLLGAFPAAAQVSQFSGNPESLTFNFTLDSVPEYLWYHGCSPTSGGMLLGYWQGRGFEGLLPGVANPMAQTVAVLKVISSPEHNAQDTWQGHSPNCLADFMKTEAGGTWADDIPTGLKGWTESAFVGLTTKTASHDWVGIWGGSFDYLDFKAEIDAGRPMILNLYTYGPGYGWVGHSVVGYGYQDSLFALQTPLGEALTVPGFALMDTWENGVGAGKQADWYKPAWAVEYGWLDEQGREWWPFLDMTLTDAYSWTARWDWQIADGVYYEPTPISGTLWLLSSGLVCLWFSRRRSTTTGETGKN